MTAPTDDWMMWLAERYPLALVEMLHPSPPPREPLALFGIECREGWKPILIKLLDRLESEISAQPEQRRYDFRVVQIKEKLGTLRVYMPGEVTDEMQMAIALAEDASGKTCEVCSASGRSRQLRGWLSTLCDSHAAARARKSETGDGDKGERALLAREQARRGEYLTWLESQRLLREYREAKVGKKEK
jgi:hypothetical protein